VTSADPRAGAARRARVREGGFTLLEVLVAFAILSIVLAALAQVHVLAVKKGGLAVDYREAREGADTIFRRITYEIDKPDWPDGRRFTFDIEYGQYIGLPTWERDRWRSFVGVLRKQRRMAAGTDPSGQIPGLEGDRVGATDRTQRREEEEKAGEATSGEEVYAVTLDVYIGEEEAAPFLTLSTYLPVPESDRRVQPTTTGAPR
jgi:prepilin-type N-terminal cleavage/methylation domain-containing protein